MKENSWYSRNKEKAKQAAQQWAKNNPERLRELKKSWAQRNRPKVALSTKAHNWKSAGIILSIEEYTRLFELQKGLCKICRRRSIKRKLAVDHCHETGTIRGLLCAACNIGLGMFQHKPELLQAAVDYLG